MGALWEHFDKQREQLCQSLRLLTGKLLASSFMGFYAGALECDDNNAGLTWLLDQCLPLIEHNQQPPDFSSALFTALGEPQQFFYFIVLSAPLWIDNNGISGSKIAEDIRQRLVDYRRYTALHVNNRSLLLDLLEEDNWGVNNPHAPTFHKNALMWFMNAYLAWDVVSYLVYYPRWGEGVSYLLRLLNSKDKRLLSVMTQFLREHAMHLFSCRGLFEQTLACLLDKQYSDKKIVSSLMLLYQPIFETVSTYRKPEYNLSFDGGDYLHADFYHAILDSMMGNTAKSHLLLKFINLSRYLTEKQRARAKNEQVIITSTLLCDLLVMPEDKNTDLSVVSGFIGALERYFPGLLHRYLYQPAFFQQSIGAYKKKYGALDGYITRLRSLIGQIKMEDEQDDNVKVKQRKGVDDDLCNTIATAGLPQDEQCQLLILLLNQPGGSSALQPQWVIQWMDKLGPTHCLNILRGLDKEVVADLKKQVMRASGFFMDLFAQYREEHNEQYVDFFKLFLLLLSEDGVSRWQDARTAALYTCIAKSSLVSACKAACFWSLFLWMCANIVKAEKEILPVALLTQVLSPKDSEGLFSYLKRRTDLIDHHSQIFDTQMRNWKKQIDLVRSQDDDNNSESVLSTGFLGV